jgi:hypothetical protein
MTKEGTVTLTPAQLSMLLEGLEWRAPRQTWAPRHGSDRIAECAGVRAARAEAKEAPNACHFSCRAATLFTMSRGQGRGAQSECAGRQGLLHTS